MNKTRRPIVLAAAALLLAILACNRGGPPTSNPATEAAQTVAAILTETAGAPTAEGSPEETATEVAGGPSATAPGEPTAAEVKPSDTPAPTNTPGAAGCTDGATYVADVTVPDDTVFAPGAAFTKTWRLRNTGTCNWVSSYTFAFVGGESMGGPPSVSVSGNVAPGAQYDVSVNLVAPNTPGTYKGTWQMRNSGGAFFGARPFVQIIVAAHTPTVTHTAPAPTATGTPTVTATSSGGPWSGVWDTDCGPSGCGQMNLVQTGNTVVGTYAGGAGTINGNVTGNRLTGTWSRGGSTGSIDFWLRGSGLGWRGNFNRTSSWCGQRPGEGQPSPCGVATWYGSWTSQCGVSACGEVSLSQDGDNVTGTYAGGEGSITGAVVGAELTGTWTRGVSNGTLKFFMTSNGQQFQGNWNSSNEWCGHRSGGSMPAPCLKN